MPTWERIQPCRISLEEGRMPQPVHSAVSEIRIKGVGRKGVSLVSQLLKLRARPQPLPERDGLSFELWNQNVVFLVSICPVFPLPDADVMAGRAPHGLRRHRLVFTLHTGKETVNNFVTKFTGFWLSKTMKGRNVNHLFNNSAFNSALFCQCSCMC